MGKDTSATMNMKTKLGLSAATIASARTTAERIVAPVQEYIDRHTTVAIERATLRLLGADGVSAEGVPVPNLMVQGLHDRIGGGAARFYANALRRRACSPAELNEAVAKGFDIGSLALVDDRSIRATADELVRRMASRVEKIGRAHV